MSSSTRPTLIRLGWQQLAAVVAGILTILLVVAAFFPASWADLYANRVGIEKFEASFGFKWGTLRTDDPVLPPTTWGVVSVVPGGAFSRLGLREGNVPFRHSPGGAYQMYEALVASSQGRMGSFDVISIHDRRDSLRDITVPPLKTLLEMRELARHGAGASAPLATASCWSDPRIPAILALGKDRAPDARAKLKAIADEAQESDGKKVAERMLGSWPEGEPAFQSKHPLPVDRFSVPVEDLTRVLPGRITATVVVLAAHIDETGCTQRVDVLRRGDYPALYDLVLSKAKSLRYVPKMIGNEYSPEKIVLTFMPEVQ